MDLILFGIQGSGKGTQGKILAQQFGYKIFETGGELRRLSKEDSELGKKVKEIIEAGHLVPNEVVMEIVENFLEGVSPEEKVLFDGLPRKKVQADTFNALLEKHQRQYIGLLIHITKEEALRRLSSRRICKNCKHVYPIMYTEDACKECGGELITRSDDNPESIKNRLNAFFTETQPVIDDYINAEKMITINGDQPIEAVTKEIVDKLPTN